MDEHGRKTEVLIEPETYHDPKTGMPLPVTSMIVWADEGMADVIRAIAGVKAVYNPMSPIEYSVYVDHRYDAEFVGKEIEAAILCKE